MAKSKVTVGNIEQVSGEVNIAGRDIVKDYTPQQVSSLLTQITSTFQPKPFDGHCPYKGLDVFEEEDAGLFFGRETLVNLSSPIKQSRDESFLWRRFHNIAGMAPEVLDIIVATSGNPLAGLGVAARKIAEKAKEETK